MLLVPASTKTFKGLSLSPPDAAVPTTRISNKGGAKTLLIGMSLEWGSHGTVGRQQGDEIARMLESTVPSRDRPAASNPDSSAMSAAAQPSQQIYILGYPIAGNGPVFRVLHVFALFVSLSFELS